MRLFNSVSRQKSKKLSYFDPEMEKSARARVMAELKYRYQWPGSGNDPNPRGGQPTMQYR